MTEVGKLRRLCYRHCMPVAQPALTPTMPIFLSRLPRLLPLLLLVLSLACPCGRAAETATAYTVPVAPWTFPDDPARGVASEYLRHLFASARVPMQFGTLPYVRVINGLRDGSNVAAMLIPDAERDTFALRLCQVTTIRSGILYKKARFNSLRASGPDLALDQNGLNGLHALHGLTIGIQRGTHALAKLEKVPGIHLYSVRSVEQGLKMLKMDRIDATFLSSPGKESILRSSGLTPADYDWLEVDVAPVVIYISRKAALAADGAALQRLRSACSGSARAKMDELMRQYR